MANILSLSPEMLSGIFAQVTTLEDSINLGMSCRTLLNVWKADEARLVVDLIHTHSVFAINRQRTRWILPHPWKLPHLLWLIVNPDRGGGLRMELVRRYPLPRPLPHTDDVWDRFRAMAAKSGDKVAFWRQILDTARNISEGAGAIRMVSGYDPEDDNSSSIMEHQNEVLTLLVYLALVVTPEDHRDIDLRICEFFEQINNSVDLKPILTEMMYFISYHNLPQAAHWPLPWDYVEHCRDSGRAIVKRLVQIRMYDFEL
ncbi:hypothetical protein BZA05DRAFT_421313 [Tricharina praecox]|uniref:uncharacterized protein n=1 Tax=Tricharina praecox TaxID=43433 RepID=UPI00221EEF49|nr:uncharacterized protein BZA05DRAFT_421313 [Tricharina praecox]KAI5845485.1 hypothetical protein BZA05DRAFT_421313 [Tricharina praecox]